MTPTPYRFLLDEDELNTFAFETIYQLTYEVRFKHTGYIFADYPEIESNTFELIIRLVANHTGKRTPPDPRIAPTIATIFKTFLARNERIIVYICDSSDLRQAARARKFDGWFKQYEEANFLKIDRNILEPSGKLYLTSLIIRRDNPNKVLVLEVYKRLTSGENDDKPDE